MRKTRKSCGIGEYYADSPKPLRPLPPRPYSALPHAIGTRMGTKTGRGSGDMDPDRKKEEFARSIRSGTRMEEFAGLATCFKPDDRMRLQISICLTHLGISPRFFVSSRESGLWSLSDLATTA